MKVNRNCKSAAVEKGLARYRQEHIGQVIGQLQQIETTLELLGDLCGPNTQTAIRHDKIYWIAGMLESLVHEANAVLIDKQLDS